MAKNSLPARTVVAVVGLCAGGALFVSALAPAYGARGPATDFGPAAVPTCMAADLVVSAGPGQAGATHVGLAVEFRNRSGVTCTLRGYPRVVALNAAGGVAAVARSTLSGYLGGVMDGKSTLPLVVTRPGQTASALVEGFDFNYKDASQRSCPPYAALLVTSPGASRAARLALAAGDSQGLCSGLSVHPVVPGTSGRLVAPGDR